MPEQMLEGGESATSVSRLIDEISGDSDQRSDRSSADAEEATVSPETVLRSVVDDVAPSADFEFDQEVVKQNLDEILLLLISLRERDTHGKGLMEDLDRLFDSRLSPGTVYPRLHDLEESDLLEMQEMVRTKEYRINDEETTREQVTSAMYQHVALGMLLYRGLTEL